MKKLFFLTLLIGNHTTGILAQTCSCSDLLNELITKTQGDYAGYIHKVREKDSSKYIQFKNLLKAEAAKTSFANCYDILEEYVSFFNDGHLFIAELPQKQPDSLAATVKKYALPANYPETSGTEKHKDPIEGVWYGANHLRFAIIGTGKDTYYGVIQQTTVAKWLPEMVKMEFEKTGNNEYKVTYYRNDFAKIHFTKIHISKNTSMEFGIYHFAKTLPSNPEEKYIDPNDPQLPIVNVLDKDDILLTIPSALIDGHYLDSLLNKNDSVIKSTPNLIIDLRGNGGGNYIWGSVYDIANTIVHPKLKTDKGDDFLLLASEDDADYIYNLGSYYRQIKDSLGIKYYDDLVNKIKKNIGNITGFSYYQPVPDTATRKVYKYPRRIAVIIDREVASASEAFIMDLKEISSKVTLYGNNTYGMIDYMNVNVIPIGDKKNEWYYFGYPTFFSKDIKIKPNNPTGIKPDVYIPSNVPDWVEWVKNDLQKK